MFRAIALPLAAIPLATLLLSGCGKRPEPAVAQAPVAIKAKVEVLNTDVLVIDGRHYALANVYAPQPVPDARCWAEALAAREATRAVTAMVARAATIEAIPTGAKDDYNRELASVRIDGADLGELLFKDGLAAKVSKGRFEWCDPISRSREGAPDVFSMMNAAPAAPPPHR
jgi:outer membrane murein-binding lipoprotein Lpp